MGIANVGNRKKNAAYSDEYGTPKKLYDKWDALFNFDIDLAATAENAKNPNFINQHMDFFNVKPFKGVGWLNPPYSKKVQFLERVYELTRHPQCTIVCLLPHSTSEKWWHNLVQKRADKKIPLLGRIRFDGAKWHAPYSNVLVIYRAI